MSDSFSYKMPDMSYAPVNPKTGQKYNAQRQVGWGVQWYDEPPAVEQPSKIGSADLSGYKSPSPVSLPPQVNAGTLPPAASLPAQVSGIADPYAEQMKNYGSKMDEYLKSAAPSMRTDNVFADPLAASQRRLSSLMDDPSSIQQTAAYKFRVGQGQEALQRQQAAKGMLGSGNRLMELTKYGQDMGSQEYEAQAKRLQEQLGLQTTGYGAQNQTNLGQYQAELGAHTARGQTLANLVGTATGASSSAYGTGMQAAVSQRGQDINAATAARGQDVGWQEAQLQSATTGRGQDLSALVAGRGQDIDWQQAQMNAMLTGRGQDVTQRGQDISYLLNQQDQPTIGNVTTRGGFNTRGY